MAPERAHHARAKLQVTNALAEAIARSGLPCEAFVDGLGVRVDDKTVFEPDALVNCGDPVSPGSVLASNPIIVVEIVSPNSKRQDLQAKFLDYFRCPSIEHYLFVLLDKSVVLHHARGANGTIFTRIVTRPGILTLDPPGMEISADVILGQDA